MYMIDFDFKIDLVKFVLAQPDVGQVQDLLRLDLDIIGTCQINKRVFKVFFINKNVFRQLKCVLKSVTSG